MLEKIEIEVFEFRSTKLEIFEIKKKSRLFDFSLK
nr:MAG TPA: hypothetical protein [Caudoviricetes sp.]